MSVSPITTLPQDNESLPFVFDNFMTFEYLLDGVPVKLSVSLPKRFPTCLNHVLFETCFC